MKMKTIMSAALALSLALSPIPAMECSAYSYYDYIDEYIYPQKIADISFVILAYKNNDGELTITGCYDYDPSFTVNPYTNGKTYGFVAVLVYDHVLEIPSHIDDMLVVDIKNLSGNESFNTIIVPDAITKIKKSAFCGKIYNVETADDECRIATMYS